MITDHQLFGFMQKLAEDQRSKNALILTDWERQFLASFTASSRPTLWFTGDFDHGRRASTDRMWRRYGAELNFPHPLDAVGRASSRAAIPDADPAGCEYLVKNEEGGPCSQRRCNEPAEFQEPGRLRYCRMHAENVETAMKRSGRRIALIKFQ